MRGSVLPIAFVALVGGCVGAAYVPPPLASVPCAVRGLGSPAEPWRQVHASEFTFCVPGSWRPHGSAPRGLDANVWSGPRGAVSWSNAAPLGPVVTRDCVTVRDSRTWQQIGPTTCTTNGDTAPRCTEASKSTEVVHGLSISIAQADCQGLHVTTATAPGIYLRAAADGADEAAVELTMLRTIRLMPLRRHS